MSLDPNTLLAAYTQGIFPMGEAEDGTIKWYLPDPRGILPLDAFHVPRRLARTVDKGPFDVRVDDDFAATIRACAQRDDTWITEDIIRAYTALHQLGFAHSVETFLDGQRVGGLYGVAINGFFAGESMFNTVTDASKVALVHLVRRLRAGGFVLLDTQMTTPHMVRFGVVEIPNADYQVLLAQALRTPATFHPTPK